MAGKKLSKLAMLLVNLNLPAIVANSLWLPAACLSLPLEPPHNFPNDKHAKTATALDNGQKEQQDGQQRQQQQQQKQQHINHNAPKRLDRHLRGIVPGPRLSVANTKHTSEESRFAFQAGFRFDSRDSWKPKPKLEIVCSHTGTQKVKGSNVQNVKSGLNMITAASPQQKPRKFDRMQIALGPGTPS
uniref:HDC07396 n=1 Tax=Drosophila melanogaster TaxID=7227 RepID=Q6IG30_DROME|nr:TPA_inf: HDC07396 [Drosophila melanogaster]